MPRMTAAERRRIEAEERDRAIHAALAWPQEPCPQPYTKERMDELRAKKGSGVLTIAWHFNIHARDVGRGCFTASGHSLWATTRTTSQGRGGPWFATESDARLAMRWAVCREMAETLHRLVEAEARAVVAEATA